LEKAAVAVTRSWEQKVVLTLAPEERRAPAERRRELPWLLCSSLMVAAGLALAYGAKTQNFGEDAGRLKRGELLNLNAAQTPGDLLPFLQIFSDAGERAAVAERVFEFLRKSGPVPNVGALARIRVTQSDVETDSRWSTLRTQLRLQAERPGAKARRASVALLPLARLKPLMVVRTPREFLLQFVLWSALYLIAFHVVHWLWRWRKFQGDGGVLPALQLLTGMGLILAVSLRDPLRDTLEFGKFAWGVALGCALLLLPLFRAFQYRHLTRWTYTPLFASFALFALLLRFGSGPSGSDSKVNLGPFQPVEIIKILIVLFLAGYFSSKWERLRELREKKLVPRSLAWLELPRVGHVLPVMIAVACALGLFFALKDLGPALVTGFLFLAMFGVARGRWGLATLGIALLVGGVTLGYRMGKPQTVVDRISMWLSPWDNDVRGGDQLAHSYWALATGGALGSGPGWGDPGMIPAGHTDLVLPAIGEEWGLIGVLAIALLFVYLTYRAFRIALAAADDYAVLLGLGLGSLIAFEMLLISGGVLGAIPLSGVVSPFLSFGNTAMLANFLIFAILLSISKQPARVDSARPFAKSAGRLAFALGLAAMILVIRAGYLQVWKDQELVARDTRVFEEDGVKRPQHNPRLNSLAREIPRGSILDRNGVPLATSSWTELEKHRADYEALGVSIEQACSRLDSRHYPFGAVTAHLLGDWRTGENFHATNASLVEHDSNIKLQGYGQIRELAPLARFRHQPANPAIRALKERDRNVRTSIDIRLQERVEQILRKRLQTAGKQQGAAIVMDTRTGDVLAMVSEPEPIAGQTRTPDELLDRARYGQYPPGSTFKLVTAMAALREDPKAMRRTFHCAPTGDGRVGARIPGWRKVIHDDIGDSAHGTLSMARAITVSCNAYFAQLGVVAVGAQALSRTAQALEIPAGEISELKATMPFAAYGQGPVLVTPFKMARVAATIAAGGMMPQGRWVIDESNARKDAPRAVVTGAAATFLADAMRSVVTGGTGRRAMAGATVSVAGKTGTAQVEEGMPHSWFAGFAPYDGDAGGRIAFAVVVEHGGYGGQAAAPVAREIVEAARDLGLIAGAPAKK
jgi:cell division protein FtsI/penicillin-binding protein 2/cell division protein FtsW (lipid II flippase)